MKTKVLWTLVKIIILAMIGFYTQLSAETVILKNGSAIKGKIKNYKEKGIEIDIGTSILFIPNLSIQEIKPDEVVNTKEAESKNEKSLDKNNIDFSFEIVSDFVWRGYSYGGEYQSRRNNQAYTSTSQYYAFQPNLRLNSPLDGFYVEFWGNLSLKNRNDKDSDLRFLQAGPGAPAINPVTYTSNVSNGIYSDPTNFINNNKCGIDSTNVNSSDLHPSNCIVDPRRAKNHKEKNGMYRTDGLFMSFIYRWETKNLGALSSGIWFYHQFDKNSNYSWSEYFIWWELPFLKVINPTFSFYTQSSFDSNSEYAGGHYASLSFNHIFREGQFFKIQPTLNIGHKWTNDNVNQRSGFSDITSQLKFLFGSFFVTANHIHRPDVYLFDNNKIFPDIDGAILNRTQNDGRVVNPSRVYGYKNEYAMELIQKHIDDPILQMKAKEKYQYQKIQRNIFYFSLGMSTSF